MLDRLGAWVASTKAAVVRYTLPWQDAPSMAHDFDSLTREGYRKNSAVFACIRTGALAFPEPPLVVKRRTARGSEVVPNHPVARLLSRPNPHMSRREFLVYAYTFQAIGGNCYILKRRSAVDGRTPVELWPMHDGILQPILDARDWITGWKTLDEHGVFERNPKIRPDDVLLLRWAPDPRQPQVGLSPIIAVAREVDTDNEAGRYVHALLRNDATPRTLVTVKGNLREDAFQRLLEQFRRRFGGDNRGDIMLLEGNEMAVNRIGLNLNELADAALRRVPETRIAAAFEVPAILAGLGAGLDSATYSNARELREFWTETTLIPRWGLVADALTHGLLREFTDDESLFVDFDLSEVRALSEDQDALWNRVGAARDRRLISLNEARTAINYPPVADDPRADRVLEEVPEPLRPEDRDEEDEDERPTERSLPPSSVKARLKQLDADALIRKRDLSLSGIERELTDRLYLAFKRLGDSVVGAIEQKMAVLHGRGTAYRLLNVKADDEDIDSWLSVLDHDDIKTALEDATLESLNAAGADLEPSLGVKVTFSVPMPEVQDVLATLGQRIVGISETTRNDLRDLIGKMLGREGGASPDQLAKAIRDHVTEHYHGRAMTIALTESGTAYNAGALLSYAKSGVVSKVKVHDGDYDAVCKKTNGKTWTLSYAAKNLLAHPRCLLPDALVLAPNLTATFAREYQGEIVVLHTADGDQFTCTPNHPVLTGRGWLAAGALHEGDHLAKTIDGQRVAAILNPDHHDVPTRVEEVACASRVAKTVAPMEMPCTPVDFHGDGAGSEVYVVRADSGLRGRFDTRPAQVLPGDALEVAVEYAAALACDRAGLDALNRLGLAPGGRVGGGSDLAATLLSEKLHALTHRVRHGASEPVLTEPLTSGCLVDAEARGYLLSRQPGQSLSGRLFAEPAGISERATLPLLYEVAMQGGCADAGVTRDILERLTSLIAPVQIVKVERRQYTGHVYNLETTQGWYVADTIVTHNCRRAFIPIVDD